MESKEQIFGDFKVRVRYSDVTSEYMHRYHIECVDMKHLIVVFSVNYSMVVEKISGKSNNYETKIQAIYDACYEFIQWLNENK